MDFSYLILKYVVNSVETFIINYVFNSVEPCIMNYVILNECIILTTFFIIRSICRNA